MYDINKDRSWKKGVSPSQRTPQQRERAQTVYQNDPAYGQVDEHGHAIDQSIQKPQKATDPNNNIAAPTASAIAPTSAKPSIANDNGTKVAWTGKFVSEYGSHFDKEQGLIFKRTDGEGGLHHFTAAQAAQMRADNKGLIDESLRNGSQGKDVKVTFSVNNGRGSWGVEPLSKQRT